MFLMKNERFFNEKQKCVWERVCVYVWNVCLYSILLFSSDGNGDYNLLFLKIFKIFDYFCIVVLYFEYFRVIFVNSSFAFTSAFVLRNFCEYGSTVFFRVQIWVRKLVCFVFRETQKCVKKYICIALLHMLYCKGGQTFCFSGQIIFPCGPHYSK